MMGDAGVLRLVADSSGAIDRWRDMGPTLWLVAGGLAALWFGLLGMIAVMVDPRRVRPRAATLEVQGTEPPAVVNLLTTDWDLGHEAIPATLIDLAARRHLEIDLEGGRTLVHVRRTKAGRAAADELTPYEEMVLAHIRSLARQTDDGRVPAEALTTGPDATASKWWSRFRAAVVDDARARGLSRPRWSSRVKGLLMTAAMPVALAVVLAMSTVPDDPEDPDDNAAGAALWVGIVTFGGLSVLAGTLSGERDTPEGRAAAARWLGLQDLLEEDPLFAEQPPAAVAIWDHLLAHGTALGVAHGVVAALPLGAESEREAWSSVGGRWRVVRIRYPRVLPPGYGRHPAIVTLLGLAQLAIGLPLLPLARSAATAVRDAFRDGTLAGSGLAEGPVRGEVPAGVAVAIPIVLAVVAVVAGSVSLRGASMTLVGLADLVTGRTPVEGRVLRWREARSDDKVVASYLAVDDGSTDRIRAWRIKGRVSQRAGQHVRADVSRRLRHVANLSSIHGKAPAMAATVAATSGPPATASSLPTPVAALGEAITGAITAAAVLSSGGAPASPPSPTARDTAPPPLPDDAAVTAAAGRPLSRDAAAAPHPAAIAGGSAIYRDAGGGHVQVVWVPTATMEVYRRLPALLRHDVPGLGDEAYRARFGGGVVARRASNVVMVSPHLPAIDDATRDDVAVRVAHAALAGGPAGAPDADGRASAAPVDR